MAYDVGTNVVGKEGAGMFVHQDVLRVGAWQVLYGFTIAMTLLLRTHTRT